MIKTSNLGYPRIGLNRELKFALEKFWQSGITQEELEQTAREIQIHNWHLQREIGVDFIPSNDFSFYDQVLDTAVMLGAIPERFQNEGLTALQVYFAMARGFQNRKGEAIHALEMTKWFNTNYHYLVPEISAQTGFSLNPQKPLDAFNLAKEHGHLTRTVILGPVSFLLLSKPTDAGFKPLSRLNELLPLYQSLFEQLGKHGAEWIQLDEPFLVGDLADQSRDAYRKFFDFFTAKGTRPNVLLTTYFHHLTPNLDFVQRMPFEGLHLDLSESADWQAALAGLPDLRTVSLGVISGRNIWRADLTAIASRLDRLLPALKSDQVLISPSCSLMLVPQDVNLETSLDEQKKSWLAFARQKLEEIALLRDYLNNPGQAGAVFSQNQKIVSQRKQFLESNPSAVLSDKTTADSHRKSPYPVRQKLQKKRLGLPPLPTTTIGSFPQTPKVRKARADFNKGEMTKAQYEAFLKTEVERAIRLQEEIGLDVLVHGEFERNDMVQYFAEQMEGFMFTRYGWVQSFGSRYVRPPIIYGAVSRPKAMTTAWTEYAQSLTDKPVKGMLTGPVTILQWSYARDDQPRSQTCLEIARAIRQEVLDLEALGIAVIQIDEPALREGLPLRKEEWNDYLDWAVACFRVASGGVKDETQIHTHMCYAEFNDIMPAISAMDADVISIEASRSGMQLLDAFRDFEYPNEVGPGIYDIHSPNVPSVEEMAGLLKKALLVISAEKLWVNPDCGLKTRKWEEVIPSLTALVDAAKTVRLDLKD